MDSIEQAIKDIKNGKMIVLTDSTDRENEGDIVCSAQSCTPEQMNFIASFAKGLICTPMSESIAKRLNLVPMCYENTDNHSTAFTVSVDHIDTTTGISAFERAFTANKLASKDNKDSDFRRPGHMFPLVSKPLGVLEREGHTEATVDLMRLAGLEEVGICCEIMDDDGKMMRREKLENFARTHNLCYCDIADLIDYRKKTEMLVEFAAKANLPTKYGDFEIYGFLDKIDKKEHVALVKGDICGKENVLARIHSECLTGDTLGSCKCDCGEQLAYSLEKINENGSGILIYLRQEGRGIGLLNKIKAYSLQDNGRDTVEANIDLGFKSDERDYYAARSIFSHFSVKSINLLTNNPAKISSCEKYDIKVSERVPIIIDCNKHNENYFKVKAQKMGHMF